MSYEAPTPPPPGAPPASPGITFNVKAYSVFDLIALGSGLLIFVFSFINRYVTASIDFDGYMGYGAVHQTNGASAWHGWATTGLLLTFAAVILVAIKGLQPSVLPAGVPWGIVTTVGAALGWLAILIRGLTVGEPASLGWSGWILVILGLVLIAATAIPLTGAAGNVEAKMRSVGGNMMPPPPAQ